MTVEGARRALVAAGARLHQRHTCGAWTAIPGGGCTRPDTCPVCGCRCEEIPPGEEPDELQHEPEDTYEGTLF